ncbi:MAG TPA: saccharopine dehydrogenase NADP-binding domain-containing protein [Pyrinomonadaceae bacterium]|nr:saccharopine dehydrogenase NADP-binding domain-containing protein [Pyrinomonadaceae bacterium]
MPSNFLLYGANGYTGKLIARLAAERGLRPTLAGRDKNTIEQLAAEHGLEHRIFALDDAPAIDAALSEVSVVLHCAGPFSRTSRPMADACLRTGTHYLDITGEASVIETLAARDAEAKAAGVMLLPCVGFDVVPSDCLAAHLKRRLPTATHLALGIQGMGRVSHGTATTMVENINRGGLVRRGGKLTPVPAAWKTREIDFGRGPVQATTIPWGDVASAFYSTGIPNIEVYAAIPGSVRRLMKLSRAFGWLLGTHPAQRFLKRRIKAQPPGPNDEERARGKSFVWGEVKDDAGQRMVSRLRGPEGYTLTALTALTIVERVLAGQFSPGFQTPSKAYGADLILEIEGVTREDLE